MKKKLKIFAIVIATVTIMLQLMTVVQATTPDHKASHSSSSDGISATKSASWIDNDKTKARVTITLDVPKKESDVSKSDIIVLMDKSNTTGRKELGFTTICTATVGSLKNFVSGVNNLANNRVAFATFSSNLFTYDNAVKKLAVYSYSGGKNGISAWTLQNEENSLFANLQKNSMGTFYTTSAQVDNVIKGVKAHWAGENTNVDLGLLYAKYLLENRTGNDTKRNSYVIIVTDGDPYPYTLSEQKQQGGNRSQDYVANKFIQDIGNDLKNNYGTEIYVVILDTGRSHDEVWTSLTGDSLNSSHIKVVGGKNAKEAEKALNDIFGEIYSNITEKEKTIPSLVVTDVINYDKFDYVENSLSCNIGTATYDKNTHKVTWNLGSNLSYDLKGKDGKAPQVTLDLILKGETNDEWLNTNYRTASSDSATKINYGTDSFTVPTPWLEKTPKYTIIEEYYKNGVKDNSLTKTEKITKGEKYTPEVKTISGYGYDHSSPNANAFNATEDKVIKHYYINYTVTEEYYKDGVKDTSLTKTSTAIPNATYTPEVKNISNYSHTSSTKTGAFKVTSDTVIKHYYTSVYKVTIKYINDETKGTMQKDIVVSGVLKDSTWPSDKSIANKYMVTDTKGQWGKGSYEIVTDKVIIKDENVKTGKQYNTSNIPKNITIDGNKELEFHYKLREGKFKTRLWVATYILDVSNNTRVLTSSKNEWVSETDTKFEKENKVTRPTTLTGIDKDMTNKYLGNRVIYKQSNPVMSASNITNLDRNTIAKIKLTDENFPGVIDFVYKMSEYPVVVHYVDEKGNKLIDDKIISNVPEGDTVAIDAKETILKEYDGLEEQYVYQSRSDSVDGKIKNREDLTNPITDRTDITVYYKKQVKVIAEYVDAIDGSKVAEPFDSGFKYPDNVATWEGDPSLNPNLSEEYYFSNRSDDKNEKDSIVASEHSTKVIYEYVKIEEPPIDPTIDYDNVAPVVSYPTIKGEKTNNATVVVGDSVLVTIPNHGVHSQMDDLNIAQPENGWNGTYGVTKYVEFPFDVYYDGNLYNANTKILVETRKDGVLSEAPISFAIPEWVEKGKYTVKAYTSSAGVNAVKKTGTKYNELYEQNEAVGTVNIEVKGKIYDFTITNLIEDKMWPTSLFSSMTAYKAKNSVDTTNKIGMLPIGQKSQQPDKYNYGIALGSTFFYRITTLGIKNKSIEILPQFTYIDESGNQIAVDLYSIVNGKYVKLDENKTTQLQTQINNQYKQQRTNWVKESNLGVSLGLINSNNLLNKVNLGIFSHLYLNNDLKVPYESYYAETNTSAETEYNKLTNKTAVNKKLYDAVSHWYGEYRLPSSLVVMPLGKDPNKSRADEIKKGYLIVSFKINSDSVDIADLNALNNLSAFNKYLAYENQCVGDEWKNESTYESVTGNTRISITLPRLIGQTRDVTTQFTLANGYYPVAIYEVGSRITSNNYEVGGTH